MLDFLAYVLYKFCLVRVNPIFLSYEPETETDSGSGKITQPNPYKSGWVGLGYWVAGWMYTPSIYKLPYNRNENIVVNGRDNCKRNLP